MKTKLTLGQEIILQYHFRNLNLDIYNKELIERGPISDLYKFQIFENNEVQSKEELYAAIKSLHKSDLEFLETQEMNAEKIEALYKALMDAVNSEVFKISKKIDQEFFEGLPLIRHHFAKERNKALIKTKKRSFLLEYGEVFCEVCKFSFLEFYGSRGKNFIEVHHLLPVSELDLEGEYIRLSDLALLCSNCHSMIHRAEPWLSIEDLKQIIKCNEQI